MDPCASDSSDVLGEALALSLRVDLPNQSSLFAERPQPHPVNQEPASAPFALARRRKPGSCHTLPLVRLLHLQINKPTRLPPASSTTSSIPPRQQNHCRSSCEASPRCSPSPSRYLQSIPYQLLATVSSAVSLLHHNEDYLHSSRHCRRRFVPGPPLLPPPVWRMFSPLFPTFNCLYVRVSRSFASLFELLLY